MNRRDFFLKTLQATAAGILVPEHLLKGRSMVSLAGVNFQRWGWCLDEKLIALQRHLNAKQWNCTWQSWASTEKPTR